VRASRNASLIMLGTATQAATGCQIHSDPTWHYAVNRDLLALQRLGGWKTLAMVTRYAHVNTGELAHTIEKLPWAETGGLLGTPLLKKRKAHEQSNT
jgi:hypothetical protein